MRKNCAVGLVKTLQYEQDWSGAMLTEAITFKVPDGMTRASAGE